MPPTTETNHIEDRYRLLVQGAKSYAMVLMDRGGRITSWSVGAERITGWNEAEVLGQPCDLIFTPEDRAAGIPARELGTAAADGRAMDLRWHMKKDGSRFFADGIMEALQGEGVEPHGFAKVLRDATEQADRAERERFLADLAERSRGLTDPDTVVADALRSVGEFLGADRCIFGDIDGDICTTAVDYTRDASVVSGRGVFRVSDFGPFVSDDFAAGRAVVTGDVRLNPVRFPAPYAAHYESVGMRSHLTIPLVHSARLVSVLGVHIAAPRRWTPEEVELVQAVAERTWLTVKVLRQERALTREAEERRVAHERTAVILESITDAFYAVDADFRFTYVNHHTEALWGRAREELLGQPFLEVLPQAAGSSAFAQHEQVMAERVGNHFETLSPIFGRWVEVSIYPTEGGGLSVYFHDISGRKALEAERERLTERERNIARQLQVALTPAIPVRIPGMALAKYYEAALDEAGVGGDFYDVFPVDKGCTALVVGDLSGKGLAAASQVATVRNMLRYALYRARTLVGALESLNSLLIEQSLLSGFATLFVGTYDSDAGTLTYVNCGQEPALVRRAGTGLVEPLAPTGPVLGAFEDAAFEERTVALGPGDALAVFTDGLTEVGRSRTAMLNIEGVADLLSRMAAPDEALGAEAVAEHLALRLVAGVDAAAAGGVMRDDMCLLVAVVE